MNRALKLSQREFSTPAIVHKNPPPAIENMAVVVEAFQTWWTAKEIGDLSRRSGFKLLPTGKPGIIRYIKRHDWDSAANMSRPRTGRTGGGGTEYHYTFLPEQLVGFLRAEGHKAASKVTAKSNQALEESRKKELLTVDLTARQRAVMDARAAILNAVEKIQIERELTRSKSIDAFIRETSNSDCSEFLEILAVANDRTLQNNKVSRRTLYNWFSMRSIDGVAGLAPELTRTVSDLPEWFTGFLKFYARPQKPAAAVASLCSTSHADILLRMPN